MSYTVQKYLSHRSICSQPSSIAGDETVLLILMVTALQQTDEEENRDGDSQHEIVSAQLHRMHEYVHSEKV